MDKYEYKLKTEQMLELLNNGAYNRAAEIADSIDWKRVRNMTMLNTVSEIYEKNRDYQKSYEVLTIAYHRVEGSRKILSRLCTLALKMRKVDEAIDYYDDFVEIAPKDPNKYVLKYQILRAQRAPIEQQIRALEQFKKSEYREEWAFELAKLYQEAGMVNKCLEECDDLILWFSEGQYVYKAMELKMRYRPLSPSQKAKYDSRFEKVTSETEELPNLEAYVKKEEPTTEQVEEELEEKLEESEEIIEEKVEEKKRKIGDTMKLDEALKALLNIPLPGEPEEPVVPDQTEDLSELQDEIAAIESMADEGFAEKVAEDRRREAVALRAAGDVRVDSDLEELKPLPEDEYEDEDEDLLEDLETEEDWFQEPVEEEGYESEVDLDEGKQPDEAEEANPELEPVVDDVVSEKEEDMEDNNKDTTPILSPDIQRLIDEIEGNIPEEEAETTPKALYEEEEDEEPLENMGALTEELRIDEEDETFEDYDDLLDDDEYDDIDDEDYVGEFEESEEDIYDDEDDFYEDDDDFYEEEEEDDEFTWGEEDAVDSDEAELFSGLYEEPAYEDDDYEEVEDAYEDDAEAEVSEEYDDEAYEDVDYDEADYEDAYDDNFEEVDEYDDYEDEDYDEEEEAYEEAYADEYEDEFEEVEDAYYGDGEAWDGEDDLAEGYEEEFYEDGPYDDEDFYEDDLESVTAGFAEEFRARDYSDEPDDREIPDEDDEIDLLSATTPLSRKETAKLIATGKTAPLPMDEIADALSISNTGFVVHGRYDLKAQSGIGTRAGLTDEQKKLFSYFVPVRGMSEQLVDVLEQDKNCTNRQGTSCTGNLLIIGNKGNGKTVLAVDVVKAIQKQRNVRQGKVAIVTGDSLNKKKISDIFGKLYGGALIIEKAGKMNEKTVARLNRAMEHDTGELYIVLEDQRKSLDRLLSSNREFRRKFTSRLEVPVFINDELVTFGQTYAQENGYKIDEMSILALYSRIDSLQREDHAVTVAEVKEIMDEAMAHSQKMSAKKLVRRVFGKNTDSDHLIILTEKDFNL